VVIWGFGQVMVADDDIGDELRTNLGQVEPTTEARAIASRSGRG
jgi:hypothetical protein